MDGPLEAIRGFLNVGSKLPKNPVAEAQTAFSDSTNGTATVKPSSMTFPIPANSQRTELDPSAPAVILASVTGKGNRSASTSSTGPEEFREVADAEAGVGLREVMPVVASRAFETEGLKEGAQGESSVSNANAIGEWREEDIGSFADVEAGVGLSQIISTGSTR